MSYVLKKKRKASIHTTRILKKKEKSVEKKSHNFLVQNFQKKKDLVVLPSTTNITILEVPPSHLTPPSFLGHALPSHAQKTSQTNTAFYL